MAVSYIHSSLETPWLKSLHHTQIQQETPNPRLANLVLSYRLWAHSDAGQGKEPQLPAQFMLVPLTLESGYVTAACPAKWGFPKDVPRFAALWVSLCAMALFSLAKRHPGIRVRTPSQSDIARGATRTARSCTK